MAIKIEHIIWVLSWSMICLWTKGIGQNQANPIIFDHYGWQLGFNPSQVLCLEKTKDGFLWIGTEQGLLRYDGHQFKSFRSDPLDETTITSNYVKKIVEDKHGRLWVSALPDLNILDPKTGKSQKLTIPHNISSDQKLHITCMVYDKKNDLMWLGTNKGLLYSQGKEIWLKQITIPEKENESGIYDILIQDGDMLWLASNDGLWQFNIDQCSVKNYHRPGVDPNVRFHDGFLSLYKDNKHKTIWIGCFAHGLIKFDLITEKMEEYTFDDYTKVQNGILDIEQSGFNEEDHILWLTTTEGLQSFDIQKHTFQNYNTENHGEIKGVSGIGFCMEPTTTEGLWIGTFRGLHRYDPYKQNVKTNKISLPGSESGWPIGTLYFERESQTDSIVWFGVPYHSFYRYDMVHHKLVSIPEVLKPYCAQVQPYDLYIDKSNILWLSSYKMGFVGYDLTTNVLIRPNFNIGQTDKPNILKIQEDKEGNLWLGTVSGIFNYNSKNNEITQNEAIRAFIEKHQLSDITYSFALDGNGKFWAISKKKNGEDDALFCFDPLSKKATLFSQNKYIALKMLKTFENVEFIAPNSLLVTSFNGFCLVNLTKPIPTFQTFHSYNDKPLGTLRHIANDHRGYVWMSSDLGVIRFDLMKHTISNFTYFNSNLGVEAQPRLTYSTNSNNLYISQNLTISTINIENLKLPKPENSYCPT